MLPYFNTWCMRGVRKNNSGPEKELKTLNLVISGAKLPLKFLAYFNHGWEWTCTLGTVETLGVHCRDMLWCHVHFQSGKKFRFDLNLLNHTNFVPFLHDDFTSNSWGQFAYDLKSYVFVCFWIKLLKALLFATIHNYFNLNVIDSRWFFFNIENPKNGVGKLGLRQKVGSYLPAIWCVYLARWKRETALSGLAKFKLKVFKHFYSVLIIMLGKYSNTTHEQRGFKNRFIWSKWKSIFIL